MTLLLGLKTGIQTLANVTFAVGLFLLFSLMFLDNTWFLLNSLVQSVGHYFQWIIQVGFQCDTFQQLQYELQDDKGENLLWRGGVENKHSTVEPSPGVCMSIHPEGTRTRSHAQISG